uniref:ATP synthase complex subunit 8 n=1 Tax=Rhithrodytes bimaculatus TaxID=224513 RepID=A0A894JSA6_9DYTI|nr:ATP synthase F0 subunit 8 [Rhithrodytes bimaculatus]QRV62858.1 ATP synthase F0 subunit 8 [Rhithrodytes bimaculatus]
MPQMAPMNWLVLYILFSLIFLIFNFMNYYSFLIMSKYHKKNFYIKNILNWKW